MSRGKERSESTTIQDPGLILFLEALDSTLKPREIEKMRRRWHRDVNGSRKVRCSMACQFHGPRDFFHNSGSMCCSDFSLFVTIVFFFIIIYVCFSIILISHPCFHRRCCYYKHYYNFFIIIIKVVWSIEISCAIPEACVGFAIPVRFGYD